MEPGQRGTRTELVLRDYLGIIRRRKVLILLVTVVVVAIALAYSLTRPKVYEASATLLLNPGAGRDAIADVDQPGPSIATEIRILRSQDMRNAMQERLGYVPSVEATTGEDSPVITITAQDGSAENAVKYADDFAEAFVEERRVTTATELQASIEDHLGKMAELDREIADTRTRVRELTIAIAMTSDPAEVAMLTAERDRLRASVTEAQITSRQSSLRETLDRLQLAASFNESRGNYVISRAVEPGDPVSPTPAKDAGIALALGLVLGLCLAFLRDYLDDSIATKDDLDAATGGLPVLGIIPEISGWRHKEDARLESVANPNSPAAEAYRALRTSLEFVGVERKIRIVHVTSSTPGEGKSTTAANLAVVLAGTGNRVVLVDCDLRKPRVHDFFGLDNTVGFTSVLVDDSRIADALIQAPGVPGLLVMPSGPIPPNPSELLSTKTARAKLEAFTKSVDYVVLDSPPLLPVSDSAVLARLADATLLVSRARSTSRRSLGRSLEILEQIDAPLEGLVLNGAGSEATYGYGYGYGYASRSDGPRYRSIFKRGGDEKPEAASGTYAPRSARPAQEPVTPNGTGGPVEFAGASNGVADPTTQGAGPESPARRL